MLYFCRYAVSCTVLYSTCINMLHLVFYAVVTADITWTSEGGDSCELQTYHCVHNHKKRAEIIWNGTDHFIDSNETGFTMLRYDNLITVVLNTTAFDGRILWCKVNSKQESKPLHIGEQGTPDTVITYVHVYLRMRSMYKYDYISVYRWNSAPLLTGT